MKIILKENKRVICIEVVGRLIRDIGSYLMVHIMLDCYMDPETLGLMHVSLEAKR